MAAPPVFLIGIMASGKSTLGQALSERLPDYTFVDLDSLVETEAGMTVSEIFGHHGQEHFRSLESDALRRVARQGNAIVACGGGTPCRTENMNLMLEAGTVVWLTAPTDVIVRRLQLAPAQQRPLVTAAHGDAAALSALVERLVLERSEAYGRAHLQFDSSRLESRSEIDTSVDQFINLLNNFRNAKVQ